MRLNSHKPEMRLDFQREAAILCAADGFICHTIFADFVTSSISLIRDGYIVYKWKTRNIAAHSCFMFLFIPFHPVDFELVFVCVCVNANARARSNECEYCVTWTQTIHDRTHYHISNGKNNENWKYQRWRSSQNRGYYFSLYCRLGHIKQLVCDRFCTAHRVHL